MFREGLLHARYCFRCEDRSVNKPNPSCKSLQSRAGDRHKQGSQHIVRPILYRDTFKEENERE